MNRTEKEEKIIFVLGRRELMIDQTGYKHRIKQMTDERIDKLYDLILEYEKAEKNIYNELLEGYTDILRAKTPKGDKTLYMIEKFIELIKAKGYEIK